jgi:hypothetical protein
MTAAKMNNRAQAPPPGIDYLARPRPAPSIKRCMSWRSFSL